MIPLLMQIYSWVGGGLTDTKGRAMAFPRVRSGDRFNRACERTGRCPVVAAILFSTQPARSRLVLGVLAHSVLEHLCSWGRSPLEHEHRGLPRHPCKWVVTWVLYLFGSHPETMGEPLVTFVHPEAHRHRAPFTVVMILAQLLVSVVDPVGQGPPRNRKREDNSNKH